MPLRLGRVGVEAISSFDGRRMVYYEGHGRKVLESGRSVDLGLYVSTE